jgi:hypothetical protein
MARRSASTTKPDERLLSPDIASLTLGTLRRNSALNFAARLLLLLFALAASVLAVVYVYERADAMVAILTEPRAGTEMIGERLLALTAPVLLLTILAGLAAIVGFFAHSRGLDESVRTLDSVNRLRREGEVAVSARGLIVAFEEQLASAKRGHTLLLWIGRTMFIVTLGLFAASVISSLWHGVDPLAVGLGVSSLAGAIFGVAKKVPQTIAHDVANVVQLELVVTGAHRQISMLESDAFASLNNKETSRADAHSMVLDVQARIERVVDNAIKQIERYADPNPEVPNADNVVEFPKAA